MVAEFGPGPCVDACDNVGGVVHPRQDGITGQWDVTPDDFGPYIGDRGWVNKTCPRAMATSRRDLFSTSMVRPNSSATTESAAMSTATTTGGSTSQTSASATDAPLETTSSSASQAETGTVNGGKAVEAMSAFLVIVSAMVTMLGVMLF